MRRGKGRVSAKPFAKKNRRLCLETPVLLWPHGSGAASLEGELQAELDHARRTQSEYTGADANAVGPGTIAGAIDRACRTGQGTGEGVAGQVEVGEVEEVVEADAGRNRE